mmetsp:Transcript_57945/g.114923  ORF Transcript_57945/g.114923 Transcript_57945/m.114923 type:complete len:229 (+) Transcript_57945:745-1431(+)
MPGPRTVTLRGDAFARICKRAMVDAVTGADKASQWISAGELRTRVGELTSTSSSLGTSTAGGNTVTTCGEGCFRTVCPAAESALCEGQVIEHPGDVGPDSHAAGGCCRFGADGSLCGEHATDPPTGGEAEGSQATTVFGDPVGRVPKEIAGDMVPEVGCLRFRNFLPLGEGGTEFIGEGTVISEGTVIGEGTSPGLAHGGATTGWGGGATTCNTGASRVAAESPSTSR